MSQSPRVTAALRARLPAELVLDQRADLLQWAGDASMYQLIPQVVVFVRQASDVQAVLAVAGEMRVPVCFRAGGTSVSGQAITDGILVVVSRFMREIEILAAGAFVRCAPGAVGGWVNAALAPYGRKIGPDPASIQAAEIGGIVANNASGMCCGIHHNSYRTITALEVVLADGWRCDTGAPDAEARMRAERPELYAGLLALRDDVRADAALSARIRTAFATKNTVGYSLNALLDAETPVAIMQKLIIGSEGTLAFIASATFATVEQPTCRATAWVMYPDIEAACAAVPRLAAAGCAAIEVLDAVALRRVASKLPEPLPPGEPAALLIELHASDGFDLDTAQRGLPDIAFTTDAAVQARYWAIRKGLFPSVGAVRAAGATVVIEDVTFPVADLAEGVRALRELFVAHGYAEAVIFGHAKDGNLHFTLTPDLAQPAEVARYAAFMAALVPCVLSRGGHLKAEHGTGRNMAPFVTAQWGEAAVAVMWRIKKLFDPHGLLNPGVLLSTDAQAHIRQLKPSVVVDPLIDRCIECGFCEPICPSRDHRTSPRQRIALMRAQARGDVIDDWADRAVDSCVGDGLCATACPVGIDTGEVMRVARARQRSPVARRLAAWAGAHLGLLTASARLALRVAGGQRLPGTRIRLPQVALRPQFPASGERWVYFPTCLARVSSSVADDLAVLCQAANIALIVPPDATELCCGQPFASKGFPAVADTVRQRTLAALQLDGVRGIVTDTATCAAHLVPELPVFDPATFAAEILLPRLHLPPDLATPWLHPTCADQHAGWAPALQAAIPRGKIPAELGCCGMAGDKGWTRPALTAAATAREHAACSGPGVTTSPTCGAALGYAHLWTYLRQRMESAHG